MRGSSDMGKSKEESRIEKMIRGLLKLPENRRCINCRSLSRIQSPCEIYFNGEVHV